MSSDPTARPVPPAPPNPHDTTVGLAAALGAFVIWGIAPVYFKAVGAAGPLEVVSHRVVWTVLMLGGLVAVLGRLDRLAAVFSSPRLLRASVLSTLLISTNWLVFIWAVNSGLVLHASLGYYINPLVNVLLGMLFLGERLNRWQTAAVILAAIAVANLILSLGVVPWVSLTLAFSFGFYALVRKRAGVDPLIGLLIETSLLAPFGLAFLLWLGAIDGGQFWTGGPWISVLLFVSGLVTGVPLVLFLTGAQRLTLASIGVMQYLAPTMHFLLAVLAFGEPFTGAHLVTFAIIWTGLALYSWDAMSRYRQTRRALAPETLSQ
ncbi:MAG: EamA family transporter RarD [Alphaproteobacteria bacterium]|jgi:chloramphenicol-sensitive protein RarD|nr:EamA family transporter RarD [Alphaproteobacteria bacterium]